MLVVHSLAKDSKDIFYFLLGHLSLAFYKVSLNFCAPLGPSIWRQISVNVVKEIGKHKGVVSTSDREDQQSNILFRLESRDGSMVSVQYQQLSTLSLIAWQR